MNKAIALQAIHKYEDAISLYNEIIADKPSDIAQNNLTEALVSQGLEDLKIHNYSKATDEFIKAISRGTKDSKAYFGLAQAYRACQINDKATEYYEKAIAMAPDNTAYSNEFAEFIAEINAVEAEQNKNKELPTLSTSEELDEITLSIGEDSKTSATVTHPAVAATAETTTTAAATAAETGAGTVTAAASLTDNKTDTTARPAVSTEKQDLQEEIDTESDTAAAKETSVSTETTTKPTNSPANVATSASTDTNAVSELEKSKSLIAIADENYKKQKYDDSIKNYKEALKINPSDEVTLLKIGNVYKIKNDDTNAIDFYKKAIFVNPAYADGWFNLGLVYAGQKKVEDSKKCFNKVVSLNPEYAYAYYALGLAYESEKNTQEALKNYELFVKYGKDSKTVNQVKDKIKNMTK